MPNHFLSESVPGIAKLVGKPGPGITRGADQHIRRPGRQQVAGESRENTETGTGLGYLSRALRGSHECAKSRTQREAVVEGTRKGHQLSQSSRRARNRVRKNRHRPARNLSRARGEDGHNIEKHSASTEAGSSSRSIRAGHSRNRCGSQYLCPGLLTGARGKKANHASWSDRGKGLSRAPGAPGTGS